MINWLFHYFSYPADSLLVYGSFDPWLVILSVAIAIFTSFMALQIAGQARYVEHHTRKHLTLAAGSIALGGGVWSMHFIGMLAFDLCTDVDYGIELTLLSMLPSIAASWVALRLISNQNIRLGQLLLGGLLVGAGIGTMHYIGMAAMQMAPLLRYDPWFFALSIVVAVSLAILALWVKFGINQFLRARISETWLNIISGSVMGFAISGMHYTGMAAARFVQPAGMNLPPEKGQDAALMAMGIAMTTVFITALVVGVNLVLRYRDISKVSHENEKRLLAMMDTAVDAIITVNHQEKIIGANQAVAKIYGWSYKELIGQHVSVLIPPSKLTQFKLQSFVSDAQDSMSGSALETEALHKDGHVFPVRLTVGHVKLPNEELFVAFVADISQRLAMEQSIRESEEKFRSLIGNIPGAAYRCLHKTGWPMLFISEAVEKITGYPASDFLMPNPKRNISDLFHPDDKERINIMDNGEDPFNLEYRIIHKDKSVRWVLETGDYIRDKKGKIAWLDGFIMDITSRKTMEDNLLHSKEKAEQAVVAKTAFLANMSHEIRTPMNAIIGFSNVLLETPMQREQHKHLSTINSAANSLLHLLNDILDSAKLEKGKLELEMLDFSLPNQLDMVLSTLSIQANDRHIDLRLELSEQVGEFYYGAPDRIRQVLTNLIGNAIKFTEQGSVSVTISLDQQSHVHFSIQDTGIGIAQERLNTIFEPFTQADASMSRRFGGTGLGTTISKQLVEQMGGRINVSSTLGEGSCFEFSLPLIPAKKPVEPPCKNVLPIPPLAILVADDIQQNRDLLVLLLGNAGHQVTTVTNGQQALNCFEKQSFDLILMDVQMPHMDGLQASQEIRKLEQQKGLAATPIIALTASVLAEDKLAASNAGMDGFASKPVNFQMLCVEIARVLKLNIDQNKLPPAVTTQPHSLLDTQQGLSLWGDLDILNKELQLFVDKYQDMAGLLQGLSAQQNLAQIAQQAHAIKGQCGNLGLTQTADLLQRLESAANQQQQDICDDIIDELTQHMPSVINEIEQFIQPASAQHTHEAPSVDRQELTAVIDRLVQAAKRNEMDENAMQQLIQCLQNNHNKMLEKIENAFDDFEFEQAINLLNELRDNNLEP
ncbi:MHYT domain-containing protein [Neptunicella sp. SCSIO 80796]|uniref:MHYT domain-containing protein n=1 Tax=Neptunicella plasticusilytica TaxID=3117012 RepID=UPI003A4D3E92